MQVFAWTCGYASNNLIMLIHELIQLKGVIDERKLTVGG
jgi:hypothetical protein